jgi:hypothetical protein
MEPPRRQNTALRGTLARERFDSIAGVARARRASARAADSGCRSRTARPPWLAVGHSVRGASPEALLAAEPRPTAPRAAAQLDHIIEHGDANEVRHRRSAPRLPRPAWARC